MQRQKVVSLCPIPLAAFDPDGEQIGEGVIFGDGADESIWFRLKLDNLKPARFDTLDVLRAEFPNATFKAWVIRQGRFQATAYSYAPFTQTNPPGLLPEQVKQEATPE